MEFENKKLEEMKAYLRERTVAIIGIEISTIPFIRYLYKLGSIITVFDSRRMEQIDEAIILELSSYNIEMSLGENYLDSLVGFDIIFRSPLIRPDTKEFIIEQNRGAILTSEIELVMELCPSTMIGVTGSHGAKTTSKLIYEILKNNYNCFWNGNTQISLFSKLEEMREEDIVILELSSLQLMTTTVSPKIAIITNISENDTKAHINYEEYLDSEKNIFKYQDENSLIVLNYDDKIVQSFERFAKGSVALFSSKERLQGQIIAENGIIKSCESSRIRQRILDINDTHLRGTNNEENICAALLATKGLVDLEIAKETIKNFKE